MRGAERSLARIADIWPSAPISTLLYDGEVFGERLAGHPVRTSRLQRLGARQVHLEGPAARDDRRGRAPAGLRPRPRHLELQRLRPRRPARRGRGPLCYCYTPFRYAWYEQEAGVAQAPRPARPLLRRTLKAIQRWDHRQAQRGTRYVAISRLSQHPIREYWGVEADIVHPPVDLHRFTPATPGDHLLFVGELLRHKQVEVALEAARQARTPITIVGGGADQARLRAEYAGSAEFLGRVDDEQLAALYASCRALIVPNIEEFGITAVEAQASGRPVIAADGGGTRETVIDGQTGCFFPKGDVQALRRILSSPAIDQLAAADMVHNAQRFSVEAFQNGIRRQVALARAGACDDAARTAAA